MLLSGSMADWLTLHPRLAGLKDGETLRYTGWYVTDDNRLEARAIEITRRSDEVIPGYFYLAGANPHEVTIRAPGGTTRMTAWIGGGFYEAWPLRLRVEPADAREPPLLMSRFQ